MKCIAHLKINLFWGDAHHHKANSFMITKYSIFLLNCTLPEGSRTVMQRSTKQFDLSCAPQVNLAKVFWMLEAVNAEMYRFETSFLLAQNYSLLSRSQGEYCISPTPARSLLEKHSPASTSHKGPQTCTYYKHTSIHCRHGLTWD